MLLPTRILSYVQGKDLSQIGTVARTLRFPKRNKMYANTKHFLNKVGKHDILHFKHCGRNYLISVPVHFSTITVIC